MKPKPGMTRGPRIAFRSEGEWVNAYFAEPDTMDDAILVGSVLESALEQTPGAFEAYRALMTKIMDKALSDIGIPAAEWVTGPGPEHERTGNA
jgi:hypothetical protein